MLNNLRQDSKFPTAHWAEWGNEIVKLLNLKQTSKGEHHGACPNCGGKDRFWIKEFNGEVMVNCRQCNDFKAIQEALRSQGLWPDANKMPDLAGPQNKAIEWPAQGEQIMPEIEQAQQAQEAETHPYLVRKNVQRHNAIIDGPDLQIPIIDVTGRRQGVQFIDEDGKKKFSYKMPVNGNFSVIGGPIRDFAYVAEGWATAASIAQATGKPVVFALNAGNIHKVVAGLREAKPNATLVVAGDNDEAGIKAAEQAFAEHGVEYILPPSEGTDFNDLWVTQGPEATRKALTVRNLLDEVFFPEDAQAQLSRNYLVKKWLGEGQMSVLYGPSNTGKSFFALDMSWHVAASQPWNGCKVQGGSVLYLATEGGNAFHNRIVALRQKYPEHKDVKLAVRPSPVNLLDPNADLEKLAKLVREVSRKHGPVRMIVVDTLSRSMAGGNENAPDDMTRFIGNVDALRQVTLAHIMIVHHSGKDKAAGARGHSSLRSATDAEIELDHDAETGIRYAIATKQRDMETGARFDFVLDVVELGQDEDGDAVTTCTISEASAEQIEEASKPKISGKNQLLLKRCFTQLRGERVGKPNPAGAGFPEASAYWTIDEEVLRDHFKGKITGASNPSQSYTRALDALIAGGHLVKNEGLVWFTGKDGRVKD